MTQIDTETLRGLVERRIPARIHRNRGSLTMADIAINLLLTGALVVVLLGLMALASFSELDEEDDE